MLLLKEEEHAFPEQNNQFESIAEFNLLKFKKRMLGWENPVEYVNNLYGCHPGDKNTEYFKSVFGK